MNSRDPAEACKDVFALLSDYLDLELPAETCEEIKEHLTGCPPCIEFAESLRATIELCREYRPKELPAPMERQAREQLLEAYKKMLAARKASS
jgi:anti-sigma factor RsiW